MLIIALLGSLLLLGVGCRVCPGCDVEGLADVAGPPPVEQADAVTNVLLPTPIGLVDPVPVLDILPPPCPVGTRGCAHPKSLRECKEQDGLTQWVEIDTCDGGVCMHGACVPACAYEMKLGLTQACEEFEAEFQPELDEGCNKDLGLLVVPSSNADELVVFDIKANPPVPIEGSPFATCQNPSRVLLDGNGDIVASCREDGHVRKHQADGTVLWDTALPNCSISRGVGLHPDGRLYGSCYNAGDLHELNPTTGDIVTSANANCSIYGITVDADGVYLSCPFTGVHKRSLKPDNYLELEWTAEVGVYGISVDGAGRVWAASDKWVTGLDTSTGQVLYEYDLGASGATGVSVGLDGNIYVAMSGKNQIVRIVPNLGVDKTYDLPSGEKHARGVALDGDGHLFTINLLSDSVTRFDAFDGSATTFGQGLLLAPYAYSGDMTGVISGCVVNGGKWTSDTFSTPKAARFTQVQWLATTPGASKVHVSYQINGGVWWPVNNGGTVDEVGNAIRFRATFQFASEDEQPTLHWIRVVYEQL